MTVNLNFNLEAWIKNLQIDASSEEEAIQKLMGMTLAEILEEGAVADSDLKITEVDTSIVDYAVTVKVTDIEYDLDPEVMDPQVIEYLKNLLPKEQTVTINVVFPSDDLEELIRDELSDATNYDIASFKFQILEKK